MTDSYTFHCSTCACILGVSIEKMQTELYSPLLYCMRCAKKEFNNHQEKNDKSVEPKGSPIVKAEASTANMLETEDRLVIPQDCSGQANVAVKEETTKVLPADSLYECGHRQNIIILDDNILSYSAYEDWVNHFGFKGDRTKCWECYVKDS